MNLRFLTAGESHGPGLLMILEGMPAGLSLSAEVIDQDLLRRQTGYGAGPRMKIERDRAQIISGVMEGKTIGAPVGILIHNRDYTRWKDKPIAAFTTPRPGHVDLAAALKYGYTDLRPGLERASARETAARVAAGAICKHLLAQFGIQVGGYVSAIGPVVADLSQLSFEERIQGAEGSPVRCPEPGASQKMIDQIEQIIHQRDTLGGLVEVIALGLPPGLGSHVHWDRRLEARLGAAILSVQAIKGVEIGEAFANARLPGTQAQDSIYLQGDKLTRRSHRAGGVEGGISTGEPLILRAAMKPIATTLTPQATVDLASGEQTPTRYERSDFCPVPRAVPILEAMVAFVLADALLEKLGGDDMNTLRERFARLPAAQLSDLHLDGGEHTWWGDEAEHV